MKSRTQKLLALILLVGIALPVFGRGDDTNLEIGISWFRKRAEGAIDLRAKHAPIEQAIKYFKLAMDDGDELDGGIFLLRCYFYKGTFVETSSVAKERTFKMGVELGEKLIRKYPNSAPLQFWYLVDIGKWAETKGAMAAATSGVATKIKDAAERTIALDPHIEDAGAYRALGVLHSRVPYIPFVMTWPDEEEALKNLEKCVEIGPQCPGNYAAYAEQLYKMGFKDKAINTLVKIVGFKPRENMYLEDKMEIREAKRLLDQYQK